MIKQSCYKEQGGERHKGKTVEYQEAKDLQESWGDKPCGHPSFTDKFLFGSKTGDFVCEQCGKFFTQRQKAQNVRSQETPSLDRLLEQNAQIQDRLAVLNKQKAELSGLVNQGASSSQVDQFVQQQESLIKLADQLIKNIGLS